jgi:small subunit ribosomal protein S1
VAKVSDAVQVGERVRVKILKLDDTTGRISLSIRQAEEDPWVRLAQAYPVGSVHRGKVLRVTPFGAFVEMARGVEALAPAREFPPPPKASRPRCHPAASATWLVLSVEADRKRMSIAPPPSRVAGGRQGGGGGHAAGEGPEGGALRCLRLAGPWKGGARPRRDDRRPRGTDLGRKFPTGEEITVEVSEVAEDGRIRLSLPGVEPAPPPPARSGASPQGGDRPRRDRDRERDRGRDRRDEPAQPAAGSGSFGTSLGDLLRAAMDKKD